MFAAVPSIQAPSAERMCEDKKKCQKAQEVSEGGGPKGIIYILCIHAHIVGLTAPPPPPKRNTRSALTFLVS